MQQSETTALSAKSCRLLALLPLLSRLVLKDPEIGDYCYGDCEDLSGPRWAENFVSYDEDGWCVEISFRCCGHCVEDCGSTFVSDAWGEVTDIFAQHYDEKTETETIFNPDDIAPLWNALDKVLEAI